MTREQRRTNRPAEDEGVQEQGILDRLPDAVDPDDLDLGTADAVAQGDYP